MLYLTTKDIAAMLATTPSEIARYCRNGAIYGEKIAPEGKNFPEWTITPQSFVTYLQYNMIDAIIFRKKGEGLMKPTILTLLDKAERADKRLYTLTQTEDILGLTRKEILTLCWKGKLGRRHLFIRHFTITDILTYIKHTPGEDTKLQDRYDDALFNGRPTLALLREIITAYAYFKQYGYII